jgi:GNAT superfamily N-acetyltransferase
MLTILRYTDDLAPAFRDINHAWVSSMFTMEPHDEHVLARPREAIVDRGGTILFVAHPERGVIGTGALMPSGPGAVELTKMGVLAEARGTGAGAFLLAALIDEARAMPGIASFYLLTSRKCEAAIHLYEKAGFRHDAGIMARYGATYARCDVAMRYPLEDRR